MSYSINPFNRSYTSRLTGHSYPWGPKTRDDSGRKAALAKLTADENAFRAAKKSRTDTPPPPKTHADRVSEVRLKSAGKTETTVSDSLALRVADLEKRLSHTRNPGDRASIERKIRALSARQGEEIQKADAAATHQAFLDSAEYIKATADAFALAEELALRADPDLPEQLVRAAIDNKEFLRRNASPEGLAAYVEREKQLRADYQDGKRKSIEITRARIKQLELDARLILLDAQPVLPSEQMPDMPTG